MTQQLARTDPRELAGQSEPAPIQRLDPYGPGGIATQAGRIAPLAIVSLGFRMPPKDGEKFGLPRATRREDSEWLHLHDADNRAHGLKAALEAGKYRRLQIAFPADRGFIQQSFTRWSTSALEIYGTERGLYLIDGRDPKRPEHRFVAPDHADFARLVRTCKAETRMSFVLAHWTEPAEGEDRPGSELVFPDGFGTYVFRTAGRHTAANIFGYLESISAFTGGRIAGIPFDLEVLFPEVVGPDGKKRTVATATIVMRPPSHIKLNSRTFRHFAAAGLEEGRNLHLPALPSAGELALEGPPEIEEIPDEMAERLAAGDFPCDYNLTVRTWHAIVRGTPLESDEARAEWLRGWSQGTFESLTAVRELSQREATQLLADLADGVSDVREQLQREERQAKAGQYDRIFGSENDDLEERRQRVSTETDDDQGAQGRGDERTSSGVDRVEAAPAEVMVKSARSPLMHRLAELIEEAAAMDIPTAAFQVVLPAPQLEVETKVQKLGAAISAERRRITPASDEEGATQVSFDA